MTSLQTDNEKRIKDINDEINELTRSAINLKLIEKKESDDFMKKIHDLINDEPDKFRLTVCSWVLDNKENKELDGLRRAYGYLAELVRKKLGEEKQTLEGYVSAKTWIESLVTVEKPLIASDYTKPYLNTIFHNFFHRIAEDVGSQSAYFCYMVYFGVPLYLYDANLETYTLLDESTEEYCYLKLRGKYYESSSGYSMPDWTEKIYINMDHVDWHYKLDNDNSIPENESDARLKLRTAYRSVIGLIDKTNNIEVLSTKSRLYKVMETVLARYYGPQFDQFDSDTWPKQRNIVEWLKAEYGLSEREAIAIDLVTRPDEARRK